MRLLRLVRETPPLVGDPVLPPIDPNRRYSTREALPYCRPLYTSLKALQNALGPSKASRRTPPFVKVGADDHGNGGVWAILGRDLAAWIERNAR